MDKNGRIAIPLAVRKKLKLKKGEAVLINLSEENVTLSNPYDIEKAQSIIAKYGKLNLLDEFLKFKKDDDSKY
jgi:AbrB family looped-hinge helix DNA binding protein